MIKQLNKKNKGFTLIEMVVVLAIIAILIAIAVPQVMKQINRTKIQADIQNARAIASALAQWQSEGGNLPSTTTLQPVSGISGFDPSEYMNGPLPQPKLYPSGQFKYKYDSTAAYLAIYAPDSSSSHTDRELYPNPDPNYK